jgi:hypothetical protein
MTNAKKELLNTLKDVNVAIKCAWIQFEKFDREYSEDSEDDDSKPAPTIFKLVVGHDSQALEEFLRALDFEYDSGYGTQELFGTVWLSDGTWLSRGEYDGSEWWEHNKIPDIPEELT